MSDVWKERKKQQAIKTQALAGFLGEVTPDSGPSEATCVLQDILQKGQNPASDFRDPACPITHL
jgi:hypothetical protein